MKPTQVKIVEEKFQGLFNVLLNAGSNMLYQTRKLKGLKRPENRFFDLALKEFLGLALQCQIQIDPFSELSESINRFTKDMIKKHFLKTEDSENKSQNFHSLIECQELAANYLIKKCTDLAQDKTKKFNQDDLVKLVAGVLLLMTSNYKTHEVISKIRILSGVRLDFCRYGLNPGENLVFSEIVLSCFLNPNRLKIPEHYSKNLQIISQNTMMVVRTLEELQSRGSVAEFSTFKKFGQEIISILDKETIEKFDQAKISLHDTGSYKFQRQIQADSFKDQLNYFKWHGPFSRAK